MQQNVEVKIPRKH